MPKYTVVTYYLRCDRCGKRSPDFEQFTPNEWYLSEYGRAVCPKCLRGE